MNNDSIGDIDEEPILWFVLADCQWKAGKLISEVKETAIAWIEKGTDQQTWLKENPRAAKVRVKILEDLKKQLESEQRPEKKIRIPKATKCEWVIGDVYAFRLINNYAKEKDLYDKYIVMIKVAELPTKQGDILPEVYILKNIFDEIPSLSEVNNYEYIKQFYQPSAIRKNPEITFYRLYFDTCSKRVMPIKQLIYMGNLGNDLKIIEDDIHFIGDRQPSLCLWKTFEKEIIDLQLKWQNEL
jgi:hypothetical protein